MLIVVLVIGLFCGEFARWYARQLRRQGLIAQLHVQQQVTDSAIHLTIADMSSISAAGRKGFSVSSGDSFGHDKWTAQVDAYEGLDGRRIPRVFVEVSGGCDRDVLRPITIKNSGAPLEGQLLDRLIRAYRARGWPHEVVSIPAADK
jgi:hypothetical protein